MTPALKTPGVDEAIAAASCAVMSERVATPLLAIATDCAGEEVVVVKPWLSEYEIST